MLTKVLLTDGTVSFEQLSNILLKWHEESPKTLLQTITDEEVIAEEEGRGLMMCIGKLTEQPEEPAALAKLDSLLCQLFINKKLVTAELVNDYQRQTSQDKSDLLVAETLLQDGHVSTNEYIEFKRAAQKIFYRRRIVALVRKQERLGDIFRSPGRDEEEESFATKVRGGIQRLMTDVKSDVSKRIKKKKKTGQLPSIFGQYEIIEEIASGGMGTVYKALQKDLGRVMALKVMHEDEETPDRVKRFLREAEAAGKLKHPNIVGIHEVGIFDGRHFFSMDFIDGVPLSTLIQETQNIDLEDFLNIELELTRAVHYAHERGVIHRDLKPANVLIDMEGHPQITDFGLAKMLDTHSRLTKSDTIIGTPFYMAPEQTRGENERIGTQTDVWGLGVILYEMLTKKLPFVGRSSIELYHKINHDEPISPRKLNPQISREVEYIIMKGMAKEIEDRYSSAKAMADDIEKYLDGEELVFHETPLYWRRFRRWFRSNKWLVMVAILAVLFGWLCGWYLLSTAK